MQQGDWIKLYRSLKQKAFYRKAEYLQLWIHIILSVGYDEKEILWNGKTLKLKPGQFITGRNSLSRETGIHRSTVDRILKFFENEQQIEQQMTTKFRLITVKNWSEYQKNEQVDEPQVSIKRASSEHQMSTNKNIKKYKNIKNNILSPKGDGEYSFLEQIKKMGVDKDKRMGIIAYYWIIKEFKFPTRQAYETALRRELKAAGSIVGYENEQIKKTMAWLKQNADFKWTLETVHKYIDEPLENLKMGGKPKTEDDEIQELRRKYA